jgi:hypothetical protein
MQLFFLDIKNESFFFLRVCPSAGLDFCGKVNFRRCGSLGVAGYISLLTCRWQRPPGILRDT